MKSQAVAIIIATFALTFSLKVTAQNREFRDNNQLLLAVLYYSVSDGCTTSQKIYPAEYTVGCEKPDWLAGFLFTQALLFVPYLEQLGPARLKELCVKYSIEDCYKLIERSKGRSIITFYREIELPDNYEFLAPAPNGRHLLVSWCCRRHDPKTPKPATRTFRLFDSETRTFVDKSIKLEGKRFRRVITSPDGLFFLVWASGLWQQKPISIASWNDFMLHGSFAPNLENCKFGSKLAFTSDSKAVWMTCQSPGRNDLPYDAAVKLSIPKFEQLETLTIDNPYPGMFFSVHLAKFARTNEGLIWYGVYKGLPKDRKPSFDYGRDRTSIRGFNLRSKSSVFEPIEFPIGDTVGYSFVVYPDFLSQDASLVALSISRHQLNGKYSRLPPVAESAEVWDIRAQKRKYDIGITKNVGRKKSYHLLGAMPNSDIYIVARSLTQTHRMILRVHNQHTGKLLQEYGPVEKYRRAIFSQSKESLFLVYETNQKQKVGFVKKQKLRIYNLSGED